MEDVTNTIEIKKSKFITYLHRTNDEQEAKEFLKQIKKSHPQARHYCTAMIIGNIVRSNDDGEPSQTAGHPMLDVLLHNQMEDIFVVVGRYFGGIKLGTGGLVRAYRSSVKEALDKATKSETKLLEEYTITFGYDLIGKLDAYYRIHQIEITLKDYNEQVTYQYLTDHDITSDLKELSNGSIQPISIGQIEWETPI